MPTSKEWQSVLDRAIPDRFFVFSLYITLCPEGLNVYSVVIHIYIYRKRGLKRSLKRYLPITMYTTTLFNHYQEYPKNWTAEKNIPDFFYRIYLKFFKSFFPWLFEMHKIISHSCPFNCQFCISWKSNMIMLSFWPGELIYEAGCML